ncbi:hypothetical protein THIOKS1860014 [Thiocapsa sp. KS1]|nr:hypothetical protein THIOKS1860014 [Thiocapsa sp. KS1]
MMRDSKPKRPPLIVKPPVLDFGTVRPGTRSERPLRIDHAEGAGGAGRVYLEEARTGLSLSATRFDSTPTTLIVTLDSTGYVGAARLETGIRIHSDGWDTHVRVRFRVRVFPRALRRGLSAAAVLLLGMAIWWAGGQRMAERAWSTRELPPHRPNPGLPRPGPRPIVGLLPLRAVRLE